MSLARRVREVPLEDAITGVAACAVGVFLVWGATRIGEITAPMYANSDIASAPVLAQLLPDQGSGHVVLGTYPWLESLFALDLTRWVPSHLGFWKAAPFFVYGAVVVTAGWTVARTVSLRTGFLVALTMAAPAPLVIYLLGASDQRLPALAHAVIMAAFIVTTPSLARWGWLRRAAWATALAVALAPGVASDLLVLLGAALPFLVAVGVGWRLGFIPRQTAAVAGGACAVGVLGGWGLERLAEHFDIVYSPAGWGLASPNGVVSNGWLLLKEVALFAHGWFEGGPPGTDALEVIRVAAGVLAIAAVTVLLLALAHFSRRFLTDESRPREVRLLAVYWVASMLLVCGPFLFTTVPGGISSVRYVFTLWPALLTLAALRWERRVDLWLAGLATMTALIGCVELHRGFYTGWTAGQPTPDEVAALEKIAGSNQLDHGYAGYWDAIPITLGSDFKVRAYPIEACGPAGYCPFHLHDVESWYSAKPDVRTFYAVGDPALTPHIGPPPDSWGHPIKTVRIGHLTVYLYGYDIASRLMPFKAGGLSAPERTPRS